jgi:ankyrin repeat protein
MTSEYPVDEPITNSGMTALSFTCMHKKPILNSELISENSKRIKGFREFVRTMEKGEKKTNFEALLKKNEELVHANQVDLISDKDQNNMVQLLINFGADILHQDKLKRGPIHYAAAVGSQTSIEILI